MAARLAQAVAAASGSVPTATVPGHQLLADLRTCTRAGDVLLLAARPDEPSVAGLRQRAAAWGLLTVWIGAGERPLPGAADFVLWDDEDPGSAREGRLVTVSRELGEMIEAHLEHSERLQSAHGECNDEVCITCSDEGRLGEVVSLQPDGMALVRTPAGLETVDTSLVDARAGDLVLIHAGTALSLVSPEACEPEEAP
jgi:hypothetical protein